MPAAARVGDNHRCHEREPTPHRGGEILPSELESVFIGDAVIATKGDIAWCDGDAYDVITQGEPTVLIAGEPAARLGDATAGGWISTGCTTVQIGPHPQVEMMKWTAEKGSPFYEKLTSARAKRRTKRTRGSP